MCLPARAKFHLPLLSGHFGISSFEEKFTKLICQKGNVTPTYIRSRSSASRNMHTIQGGKCFSANSLATRKRDDSCWICCTLHVALKLICRLTGHECSLLTARASSVSSDVISMSMDGIIKVSVCKAWGYSEYSEQAKDFPRGTTYYRSCLFHITLDKDVYIGL